jgi:hypothetical protein
MMPGAPMRRTQARAAQATAQVFPLSVSASGRYLQQQQGAAPFLLNIAAAAWDYVQGISLADFQTFADAQKVRGFNALHVSIISNDQLRFPTSAGNHFAAPNWNNGGTVAPFITPGDYSTPNPVYFAHVKQCIQYLEALGMVALCQVSYLGYNADSGSTNEGWGDVMQADTSAHMTAYGAYLGALLGNCKNVIYGMGGDARPSVGSTLEARLKAIVDGVISVDPSKLWVAHWDGDTGGTTGGDLAYDQATFASYSQLLWSHYGYNPGGQVYTRIAAGYAHSPTRPTLLLDESYEGDPAQSTALELRAKQHSGMCAGSASLCYARGGTTPTGWVFAANVTGTTGTTEHGYTWTLWSGLPWASMAPDTSNTFVTAGRGTLGTATYVTARASSSCLAAYLPNGAAATITVAMTQFSSAKRARWFDPTAGTYTLISSSLANTGTQNFTQPAARGDTTSDVVLVLD